jgi:hypothetical protein
MAFTKGQSGNPAGRPAGAKDKTTKEIREAFQSLEATAKKDPAKALDFMLKLSEYTVPKLKAIQLTTGLNTEIHVTFPKEPDFEEVEIF